MSGIYGMVRYDGAPVTTETLAPVAAAMSFWGPDGHGQWCGDSAGLGHLMLHVTPESLRERLPTSIRVAPHLIITADARIDNRDELFDALGVPEPGRDQTPDSSLILLAYERWGTDCVRRLLGDFAFAIWDSRERRLFCARDHFGCKPFVYHHDGKRFIFASDVKGVLARVESPRLNEPLLAAYLQMATHHAEKRLTFFHEIVKLPSAHTLILTAAGPRLSRYWIPEDAPEVRLANDTDYAEQMRDLFHQSVHCRTRSAFPIGSHLSGGLDSSSVSIVAARHLRARRQQLAVFSWSSPREPDTPLSAENEHTRIDSVCKQEDLCCQYAPASITSFLKLFQRDATTEPTEMMAWEANVQERAAAQGLRVMLSGWGGDDAVTCSTTSYISEFFSERQWSEFWKAARYRLAGGSGFISKARRVGGICRQLVIPNLPDSLYSLTSGNMFLEFHAPCINAGFARRYREQVIALRGPAWRTRPGVHQSICHLLDYGHIVGRLEDWATSGATHGLEYRYPMLDKRLVEFVLGTPSQQFCRPDQRRSLFFFGLGMLLPSSADWGLAKRAPDVLASLRKTYYEAHAQWGHHLISNLVDSPAMQFIDPQRIQRAIASLAPSDRAPAFSGLSQAFGCFAIISL